MLPRTDVARLFPRMAGRRSGDSLSVYVICSAKQSIVRVVCRASPCYRAGLPFGNGMSETLMQTGARGTREYRRGRLLIVVVILYRNYWSSVSPPLGL